MKRVRLPQSLGYSWFRERAEAAGMSPEQAVRTADAYMALRYGIQEVRQVRDWAQDMLRKERRR
jgi:hypothetical protein